VSSKNEIDLDEIGRGLGAERRGRVHASGGWFGAAELVAEVQARFRSPAGGGRGTDSEWTERRLLPLTPDTLKRLEHLSEVLADRGVAATPLQVAALLLERAVGATDDATMAEIARARAS
jgi:hypothetical protein